MTEAKAAKLADNIRAYWKGKGYDVQTQVVREPWVKGAVGVSYGVRTNLVNGFPPDFKGDKMEFRP